MTLSTETLALVGISLTIFTGIIGFVITRQDKLVCDLRKFVVDRQDKMFAALRDETVSLRIEDKSVIDLAHERIDNMNDQVARRGDLDNLRTDIRDLKAYITSRLDKMGESP